MVQETFPFSAQWPIRTSTIMPSRAFRVAAGLLAALLILLAPSGPLSVCASAQGADAKSGDKNSAVPQEPGKDVQKVDEYAEAQRALGGPAGNPECVWLGRRVVSLLWRDDLDTAFRHFDLYDRFGCPPGHVQLAFPGLSRFREMFPPCRFGHSLRKGIF